MHTYCVHTYKLEGVNAEAIEFYVIILLCIGNLFLSCTLASIHQKFMLVYCSIPYSAKWWHGEFGKTNVICQIQLIITIHKLQLKVKSLDSPTFSSPKLWNDRFAEVFHSHRFALYGMRDKLMLPSKIHMLLSYINCYCFEYTKYHVNSEVPLRNILQCIHQLYTVCMEILVVWNSLNNKQTGFSRIPISSFHGFFVTAATWLNTLRLLKT